MPGGGKVEELFEIWRVQFLTRCPPSFGFGRRGGERGLYAIVVGV